jgi:hypothetical protein
MLVLGGLPVVNPYEAIAAIAIIFSLSMLITSFQRHGVVKSSAFLFAAMLSMQIAIHALGLPVDVPFSAGCCCADGVGTVVVQR